MAEINFNKTHQALLNTWGSSSPGTGCIFITPEGKYLNLFPKIFSHDKLCDWVDREGYGPTNKQASWFSEKLDYIRCRNNRGLSLIELPAKITTSQLDALQVWLETKVNDTTLDIGTITGDYKSYNLTDYFPEDIIKIIKRYYSSGKLYENKTQLKQRDHTIKHFTDALFEEIEAELKISTSKLQEIVNKIKAEVDAHEGDGPYGNQNCMLCTWAVELQLRGENFLPRAVISPDDIIFNEEGHTFVSGGKKEKFKSIDELISLIENGARYYCHVNWADSTSGHEFLLVDDGDVTYIVDGQAGKVIPISEDEEYFNDINFDNSYVVRVDNKELNQEIIVLNDPEYMSKTVLNESALTKLYFISPDDLDGQTLEPRVPNNFLTKNGYEDGKTPRVCFAPTIDQCLMGLSQNLTGKEFFVFNPINVGTKNIYKPTTQEVPDTKITGETWVTCPVKIKKIGKIKVLGDSGLDGHSFSYGDNTAELYDWDWEWVSSDLKEDLHVDSVNSPEELMDWMNENITYELVDDEYSNSNGVPTKTAEEVLETKTGHCAEQSYLEKEILDGLGYESFLVMVKENNSKKEYGVEGSAHVFLVYQDENKNYCWFEHSMQHARGIHKYTSLKALLQDVANQWWRYDKNSDILEVRMMDKYITGVDNWGLAKECYKYPVEYTFDISNNIMESDVPLEESLTTKIVRRDNPADFSPFGYKVDFYDEDKHIGEGSVCGIKDDNAFLYDFEVYPEFRGKGYSKPMLQFMIDKYDLKQLFVKPDNTIAINLYKKYGFEIDKSLNPEDIGNMLLMTRD